MKVSSSYRVLEAAALVHREMHTCNHSYDYAMGKVADSMFLTSAEWIDLKNRFAGETKELIKADSKYIHNNLMLIEGFITAFMLGLFAVFI